MGAKLKSLRPRHLEKDRLINLGAFYTDPFYVNIVWKFIEKFIDSNTVILDPACGYGTFLRKKTEARKIGNDIDIKAITVAKNYASDVTYFNYNSLVVFKREAFGIRNDEKLIIIGNPPYNDVTSQAKKKLKKLDFEIDPSLKTRDIGISFLRMFDYLKADYVCILHPLSYLIKKANFRLLRNFKDNYALIDGIIISSRSFELTSKTSEFPIIIALYKRESRGMNYEYIQDFEFKTIEGKSFRLRDFDYIGNYIDKYPKKTTDGRASGIYFYMLRDINALKRNRTFIDAPIANAIEIDIDKLDYYVYVDVFKDFIKHIPYYLGNLDIIIDIELFNRYKEFFISYVLRKRKFLKDFYINFQIHDNDKDFVLRYFKELLKEHFMP